MARKPRKRIKTEQDLIRFGVSIPKGLAEDYDAFLVSHDNLNRSEGIRELIRDRLAQAEWASAKGDLVATLTMRVEAGRAELQRRLAEVRREFGAMLLFASQHPLNEKEELHLLVLRGPGPKLQPSVDRLLAQRGVLAGKVVVVGSSGGA
ncbi:MAG: hypothetical protein M5U26_21685 [Planctomycetota bacterium]|nr:hypothetical protein [Planctomycetota bacterium]